MILYHKLVSLNKLYFYTETAMTFKDLVDTFTEQNSFFPIGPDGAGRDAGLRFAPACGIGHISVRSVGDRILLISADIVPEFNVPLSFPDHELWSIGAYEHVSAGGAFEENVRRPHTLYTHTPANPPLPIVFHGGSRLRGKHRAVLLFFPYSVGEQGNAAVRSDKSAERGVQSAAVR